MNLNDHKFIVFAEEHYNPLGVIRSLGEQGIHPIAIIIEGNPVLASKSKWLSKVYYVKNREEGVKVLLDNYANEIYKPFLYFCDDTTVNFFNEYYFDLRDKFYFFNAGKKGKISFFLNKENIGKLALKHGLNFLEEMVVNRRDIPKQIEYPVITKSIDSTKSGWKNDMHICHNFHDLQNALNSISSPQVMIQKYINKKNEYCLEGFSCPNGSDICITIESTYNYNLPMTYSPYMTVNNFSNKNNVLKGLKSMFQEIGFEGIFEVEFLEGEDGTLYFGEINFRNSTWSYASTCAGMNLPILWASAMISGKISSKSFCKIEKNKFKAMVELTDFKERVIYRHYSIIKWLNDLKNCQCRYYLGKNDIKPVLMMLWERILRKIF